MARGTCCSRGRRPPEGVPRVRRYPCSDELGDQRTECSDPTPRQAGRETTGGSGTGHACRPGHPEHGPTAGGGCQHPPGHGAATDEHDRGGRGHLERGEASSVGATDEHVTVRIGAGIEEHRLDRSVRDLGDHAVIEQPDGT